MRSPDLILLSLTNLSRQKSRTTFTVIGVVVGTCAIILMISLGIAVNRQNEAMLAASGDLTKITIYNYSNGGKEKAMDDKALSQIRAKKNVVSATPFWQADSLNGTVLAGKRNRYSSYAGNIYGVYPDSLEALRIKLESGAYLTDDTAMTKKVIPVLVGQNFGYSFEDTKRRESSAQRTRYKGQTNAKGEELPPFVKVDTDKMTLALTVTDDKTDKQKTVLTYNLKVVGVMASNYGIHYATDNGILMRLGDLQKLEQQYQKAAGLRRQKKKAINYDEVYVKCANMDAVAPIEEWIHKDMGFENTNSMTDARKNMQQSVAKTQMILGGLASISLLVAMLNIMNTMTMAVSERRKEIGVLKVLGCKLNDIRMMFLLESGMIGFLGGLIGIGISLAASWFLNHLPAIMALFGNSIDLSWITAAMGGEGFGTGEISIIPLWLILAALLFASLVGLLSGLAPANKAVKISALQAIKSE